MNYQALLIGIVSFLSIGLFHPIVVRLEYYFGKKIWWAVFFPGLGLLSLSLFASSYLSIILGVIAFGCFWTTVELFFQHKRVIKGQAKRNPNRDYNE